MVLSTGIFALTLTFLRRETQAKWVVRLRKRLQPIGKLVRSKSPKTDEMAVLVNRPTSQSQEFAVLVAIGIIYFVLVFEHELSPYVVLIQLGRWPSSAKYGVGGSLFCSQRSLSDTWHRTLTLSTATLVSSNRLATSSATPRPPRQDKEVFQRALSFPRKRPDFFRSGCGG